MPCIPFSGEGVTIEFNTPYDTQLDTQLDALKHGIRRALLLSLETQRPVRAPATVETAHLAPDQRLVLRHVHLPKLQMGGYVDWDVETGRVTRGPQYEEIQPLLRLLVDYRGRSPDVDATD